MKSGEWLLGLLKKLKPLMSRVGLIDINNFYVSCERIFRPDLQNTPVVVLSNNDGCVVSRSNEIKKLGVNMASPYFKIKDELDKAGAVAFSSNYTLYGDISGRVMNILAEYGPIEIYSIDEAFLDVSHVLPSQLIQFGKEIKDRLRRDLSLPVCVGFAETKTLAKVANEIAKEDSKKGGLVYNGVISLVENPQIDELLESLNVADVWGIGRQNVLKVRQKGIYSAKDLKYSSQDWIKANLAITGLKIVQELNGQNVTEITSTSDPRKGIVSSRSFGKPVTTFQGLQEAVSTYITRASEKLRKQKSVASYISVFVMTNRFDRSNYYSNSQGATLSIPTNYTPELVKQAFKLLEKIYQPGMQYKKAGVAFWGLLDEDKTFQIEDLFTDNQALEKSNLKQKSISKAVDKLNRKYGSGSIVLASNGLKQAWKVKSDQRSPNYTTDWDEILRV
ncbi:MAG: Y-family DNA polymerase [bacterium]